MNRRAWIIAALAGVLALMLILGLGVVYLASNVPGVARLLHGDPPTSTPVSTLRATFTPALALATLTPNATPTSPEPSATPLPTATAMPSPTPTDAPPTQDPGGQAATVEPTVTPLPPTATLEPPTATSPPPTATATATPKPQWLVFETHRKGRSDYEIFAMAPDGSQLTNLTNSWADDLAPVWSPDGRRVAFVSLRDTAAGKWGLGPGSIYLMDFDPGSGTSGNVVRLTDKKSHAGWPTWSPDGKRIAFESDRSGNWEIWAINVDGSGLVNLTNQPGDDRFPAWSPDGKKIAFTSNRSGNYDVWLMNADGSNAVNLTKNPSRDRYAMWSPDGTKIAFNSGRDGNQEIYVMNADGSNQKNVSNAPKSVEGLADWSPDGKRLVFYSDRPGNKDIFVLNLANGKWTNITNDPASDEFCTWSP